MAVDRIESARGRLESATEPVDTTTSTGRFTRGMLAEVQTFEAERIGETWREVYRRRREAIDGLNRSTGTPTTRRSSCTSRIPSPGRELVDAYRRNLASDSVYTIVPWLNGNGWTTRDAGFRSDHSLRRVMDARLEARELMAHGELLQGVHQPLIDVAMWRCGPRGAVRPPCSPAKVERSQYLLSVLVVCGRCGCRTVARHFGHAEAALYRCHTRRQQGPARYIDRYVIAS